MHELVCDGILSRQRLHVALPDALSCLFAARMRLWLSLFLVTQNVVARGIQTLAQAPDEGRNINKLPDWSTIKAEYEQGQSSLRQLAQKHGISKTYLIEKRDKEQWKRPTDRTPTVVGTPLALPMDAHSIARIGLRQLALHLQADGLLEIRDHKSLSDALAQYVKVLSTTLQEEQEPQDGLVIPLDRLSAQARMEIRRILVEDEQRREGIG